MTASSSDIEQAGIIEYVTFASNSGVSPEALKEGVEKTDVVLDSIDGFLKRFFAQQDDGLWVEVVFWRDKKAAEAGLEIFLKDPRSQALLQLIENSSVSITYSKVA